MENEPTVIRVAATRVQGLGGGGGLRERQFLAQGTACTT
jgi:hypothetical protein